MGAACSLVAAEGGPYQDRCCIDHPRHSEFFERFSAVAPVRQCLARWLGDFSFTADRVRRVLELILEEQLTVSRLLLLQEPAENDEIELSSTLPAV